MNKAIHLAAVFFSCLFMVIGCTAVLAQNDDSQQSLKLEEAFLAAKAYSSTGQTDSCEYILELLKVDYDQFTTEQQLEFLYIMTDLKYSVGQFIHSIEYAKNYIDLINSSKLDNEKDKANIQVYLGLSYYFIDELGLSIDAYLEALAIYKKSQDRFGVALSYYNVGKTYADLKDYEKSIAYLSQAIQELKSQPQKENRIVTWYAQLANVLIKANKLTKAESILDSASILLEQSDLKINPFNLYITYGRLFAQKKNILAAEEFLYKAIELAEERDNINQSIEALNTLSFLYNENKRYSETIALLEHFINKQRDIQSYQTRLTQLEARLYEAYVETHQYKEAIILHEEFTYLRDSMSTLELYNQMKQAEIRSQAAKQATENELLKKQDELNQQTIRAQNTLLISSLLVLVLVIVIAIIIYRASVTNKRLSKQNQQQADRLIQLDAAKSRFFANISHDLRTPMTLIMGGIEQVLENNDVFLTDKAARQLKIGLKNGERILHLTNEINELIKLEDSKLAISPRYIDIDEMLNLFVQMFSSMAEMKGVHLAYSRTIFKGSTIIHADPHHFEKVLFNLITNGLKHTKEKDSLTVSLSQDNGNLVISIVDTGEGIPEQNVPYIFDRYYQAPDTTFKTQEGFGIGLALVKEIIDKHQAKIEVNSKLGIGTEFKISIHQENVSPNKVANLSNLEYSYEKRDLFRDIDDSLSSDKPLVHIESIQNDARHSTKKKTILIVEDHPEVRDYIYDIIAEHYTVLTAANGKRALRVLEKDKVDLIITDLMMPWFDGFELLEQLKQNDRLKRIPALVLSARTSDEDKERVLSKGVNDFLCKPFKPKELLKRIENLLNRSEWNNNNEEALFINNAETVDEVESSLLKNVEQLILANIHDPNLSINFLAEKVYVSERKFYRLIKKLTGTTPYEYLKEVRLQYANRIILEKKLTSTSEVARMIGMKNVSNFNNQFKKRFGKKPSDLMPET
ncbi:hypothetical protein BFP72_08655 [Reichenbachiella sp. 5M10]|uniref:response regulator n=1 Tax=Reichenbachiella sp. 5M10 TaxID=1889772 RepID=UPI000C15FDC1|nr:response regulator [Reichenbachiella sp. 5M10]PIB35456.1 hypothetical protein BFP72_08655 [Reichenbachiella sp. 5M10]